MSFWVQKPYHVVHTDMDNSKIYDILIRMFLDN